MRLLTCTELCELLSDSEQGHFYTVRYRESEKKFCAKGRYGVIRRDRYDGHFVYSHIGWFDDYTSCRDFLQAMLKGVK